MELDPEAGPEAAQLLVEEMPQDEGRPIQMTNLVGGAQALAGAACWAVLLALFITLAVLTVFNLLNGSEGDLLGGALGGGAAQQMTRPPTTTRHLFTTTTMTPVGTTTPAQEPVASKT